MKRLIIAAVMTAALTPAAQAANVDCARPLTSFEYKIVPMGSTYYAAYPQQFNSVMTEFCTRGQQARAAGESGQQVAARIDIEGRQWVARTFGRDTMKQKEFDGLVDLLSSAGLRGYMDQMPAEPNAPRKSNAVMNATPAQQAFYKTNSIDTADPQVIKYANAALARVTGLTKAARAKHTGEMCYLIVTSNKEGMITGTRDDGGDAGFCAALLEAVKGAKMPPIPGSSDHLQSLTYVFE